VTISGGIVDEDIDPACLFKGTAGELEKILLSAAVRRDGACLARVDGV